MYILKNFINAPVVILFNASTKRNIYLLMDPLLLPAIIKTPTLKKIINEEKISLIMEKINFKKMAKEL